MSGDLKNMEPEIIEVENKKIREHLLSRINFKKNTIEIYNKDVLHKLLIERGRFRLGRMHKDLIYRYSNSGSLIMLFVGIMTLVILTGWTKASPSIALLMIGCIIGLIVYNDLVDDYLDKKVFKQILGEKK